MSFSFFKLYECYQIEKSVLYADQKTKCKSRPLVEILFQAAI